FRAKCIAVALWLEKTENTDLSGDGRQGWLCPCAPHNSGGGIRGVAGFWCLGVPVRDTICGGRFVPSLCTAQFGRRKCRNGGVLIRARPCARHNSRQRQPCPDSGDKDGFSLN